MEHAADSVARVLSNDAAPIRLCNRLDHAPNLAVGHTRPTDGNGGIKTLTQH